MNAAKQLWLDLRAEGRSYLPTKAINQDPWENLNSSIRSCGGNRSNPFTSEFESAFITCLIDKLTVPPKAGNCKTNDNDLLLDLKEFLDDAEEIQPEKRNRRAAFLQVACRKLLRLLCKEKIHQSQHLKKL